LNRRNFVAQFASGLAGAAAATERGSAASTPQNGFYLLESFRLQQGTQRTQLDEFFTSEFLPARDRIKASPALILEEIGRHEVLVVVGGSSLAELGEMRAKIAADAALTKALAKWESGPEPPYDSSEVALLEAAPYSPPSLPVAPPDKAASLRCFELRVYHARSGTILRALHERLAGPETNLFARSGIHPVLCSNTIIGPDMPNLTYLIPFDSYGAFSKAWIAFNADQEWLKMVREEYNKHGQLVRKSNLRGDGERCGSDVKTAWVEECSSIYRAAAYSPVK